MPFVARHRQSGEIAAAVMKNIYDLDYYGVRWWETEYEARAAMTAEWEIVGVEERKLKIMNARLNNDPRNHLLMDDEGRLYIRKS